MKQVEKSMRKFVGLRAKTYSYLIDDSREDKKAKGTNKCHKKNLNLRIIKTVQKQPNLRIRETISKKIKLIQIVLNKIIKNS